MTTYHCIERAKERLGLNERKAIKMIELAIERGKTCDEFTSWERNYLEKECRDGSFPVVYNDFCYILSNSCICITLFPLPIWFGKKKRFDGKEKVRNAKKYSKSYDYEAEYDLCYC